MNKDTFRSTHKPGQPIPPAPTQRLGPSGTSGLPRVPLAVPDPELLGRASTLVEKLEARVELLMRACQRAKLPMPGVVVKPFKHPVQPNGGQIVDYLEGALAADAKLAQGVQVALYRFQQVGDTVAAGDQPTDLEAFRRQVFFLTNLAAEFKTDPILCTLFPAPQAREGALKAVMRTPEDLRREAAARDEVLRKALALGQALAPRMAVVKLVLDCVAQGLASNVGLVLTPQGRQAKMIAVSLTGDARRVQLLTEAYQSFERLKEVIPQVRAGQAPLDAIKPLALPLGALGTAFADHVLLRDLFTRPLPGAQPPAGAGAPPKKAS